MSIFWTLLSSDYSSLPLWLSIAVLILVIPAIAFGAGWLVDGAANLARRLGVSELIIGLTVVSIGTSAPEFAVSIGSALSGFGDVALGNVVGSNIFNLGMVLGGCAMVRAIPISKQLFFRDGFVLLAAVLLVFLFAAFDLLIARWEGAILLLALCGYLVLLSFGRRRKRKVKIDEDLVLKEDLDKEPWIKDVGRLLLGLGLILSCSHMMVHSASAIASSFGMSQWVIGVTIIAAGTSTPELATSLVSVIKGRFGIAAGNVLGSDVMNFLGVIGLSCLLHPVSVDSLARVSLLGAFVMVAAVAIMMRTNWKISRVEGVVLLALGLLRWGIDIFKSF